ncbi:MAG: MATE family efflux transporter, partial [Rubellimicrobium sp.]|nr:MATE family efflux transporter [Rubellimicrobium sp.]
MSAAPADPAPESVPLPDSAPLPRSAPGPEPGPVPAPVTHARVLRIAGPVVLSNATVPLLGAVDTGVIGQLGSAAALGAVGLGAVVLASFYWIFGFLRMGTTGFVAQARGAGDRAEVSAHLMRALLIGGAAGVVLIAGQLLLWRAAFAIAPASAGVEALARSYLAIRIWGAPATICLYAVTGWLIAMERTRAILLLQLVINGVNIILDLWLVIGLGAGVEGVAAATLVAEWGGFGLGLWLCRAAFAGGHWRERARILARDRLRRLAAVNGDIMVRSVLLQGAFTSFVFLGAGQGDVTLAANQVLMQFLEVSAYALDGFAFAAEAMVGAAVGAGSRRDVRAATRITGLWGAAGALVMALAFLFAGTRAIDLLSTSPEVRAAARIFLPWLVAAPLLGVASWMLDGVFIGATWTREMRVAMLWSVAAYALALLVLVPAFGNHGLWAALMVLFAARAATLGLRFPALVQRLGA